MAQKESDQMITENDRKRKPHPYLTAGAFSRSIFWWLNAYFLKAYKQPLKEEDMFDALPWDKAEYSGDKFERKWNTLTQQEKNRKGSLFIQLFLHFKKAIIGALIVEFLNESMLWIMPILIAGLVKYLDGSGRTSPAMAYVMLALIIVFTLALIPGYAYYFVTYSYVAMGMRATCSALIYKKVLSMSNRARCKFQSGHIVTLMSTDVETFHHCMQSIHTVVFAPVAIIAFVAFQVNRHGISVMVGVFIIFLYLFVRSYMGRLIAKFRYSQQHHTDKRVHLMSEIISAMRVIKMYCWEKPFAARASQFRKEETNENKKRSLLLTMGFSTGVCIGRFVTYFMVLASFLMEHDITPESTIELIGWLKALDITVFRLLPSSFGSALEALGATERIKNFLMCEDFIQDPLILVENSSQVRAALTDAWATWDLQAKDGQGNAAQPTLQNINIKSSPGELIGITGMVGSGKSSILMAILGELPLQQGDREVRGSIAYVPQEPWILSETVRKNILLDSDMDHEKYDTILKACTLDVDLKQFPKGDLTIVGERGLTLSGGQKARVSLARAMYQDADIYLFDDPLAAVDDKVGRHIVNECICGWLKNRLRILVTHHLQYLTLMDKVYIMDKGKIIMRGKHEDISDIITKHDHGIKNVNLQLESTGTRKIHDRETYKRNVSVNLPSKKKIAKDSDVSTVKNSIKTKEEGGISSKIYAKYLKAGNGQLLVPAILLMVALSNAADVAGGWLLSQWNSQSNFTSLNDTLSNGPISEYDGVWYIGVLGSVTFSMIFFGQLFIFFLTFLIVIASRRLYNEMFEVILHAPIYFFETNPVGQILNRFSRDTGFMDIFFAFPLFYAIQMAIASTAHLIYICIVFPWMVLLAFPFMIVTLFFVKFSIRCIRDAKRIEGICRSPSYSHLSTTIEGLSVIRAFRKQNKFLLDAYSYIDKHTAAWHLYISAQRYLAIRIDFFASVLGLIYITVAVLTASQDASAAGAFGLSFIYLIHLLSTVQFAGQMAAETETVMTSVERIMQFSRLEQEAPDHTNLKPPLHWPSRGAIQFKGLCLTYRNQKNCALGPISANIRPAEKVGVVGRTGAGKSSLFVSLLRMVEPTGSIFIDGLDITKMGLTDLRSNISVIPQDPVLFSGSLRFNLDPFEEFEDNHLWEALRQVQLHSKACDLSGGLSAEMGEAGGNFSVGEKQLLCMARALIRRNKIIIVDEATANVDNKTDEIIQRTLNTEFSNSTVLTIAHRLNTIITYDKIMVLDNGKLVEIGHPHILLQDSAGMFHSMLNCLGNDLFGHMCKLAKRSYTENPPMDVSEEVMSTDSEGGTTNLAFEEENTNVTYNRKL